MKSLEERIEHFARLTPDKAAVISGNETLSYSSLWQRIQEKARQLKDAGLQEGQPYVFITTQDTDFLATYCAVHVCGAVSVPLERSTPLSRQQQIRNELNAPLSTVNAQMLNGQMLNGQCSMVNGQCSMVNGQCSMLNGQWSMVNGQWSMVNAQCSMVNAQCSDILYTTGTTGDAKGVMLSQKAWTANAENLIDRLGFTSDLLFIVCGPLNHLGSLSKIYPTLMTGGTLFLLENLKDLNAFFSIFSLPYPKFATFLVPSSIRMLLQVATKALSDVSEKIDFIETGAAPISQHDMEQLCQILPHARLYNTYASTETGIVCSYEYSKYGCQPGLLGKPMMNSSVRIDTDGRVICSGHTIMSGYVNSPEATAKVLKDGEIYTSDIGSLDQEGRLQLQGRMNDVINVGGYKVNPSEVEDAVSAFDAIKDCICIPAQHIVLGTVPKLVFVPKDGNTVKPKDIADFLKNRIEDYKIPILYEAAEAIKRTYNGKLDRKAYQ